MWLFQLRKKGREQGQVRKVIVIPKNASSAIPKGNKRQKLVDEIEMIEMKQTMSSYEVASKLQHGFSHLQLTAWHYLEIQGGQLVRASNQNMGGEIVDKRGVLYIQEKDKENTYPWASSTCLACETL